MEYPRLVYKRRGASDFDHLAVDNDAERKMALETGVWFDSVPEALRLEVVAPAESEDNAEEARVVVKIKEVPKSKQKGR